MRACAASVLASRSGLIPSLVGLSLLTAVAPARATSLRRMGLPEMVAVADRIVHARVVVGLSQGLMRIHVDPRTGEKTAVSEAIPESGIVDPPFRDSSPNPAAGEVRYWLVRARNECNLPGRGTFGDSTPVPDPRDALDAGAPCP